MSKLQARRSIPKSEYYEEYFLDILNECYITKKACKQLGNPTSLSKQRIGRGTTCGGDKKEASFVYGVVREKET